ncbi:hypothetical protein H3H37_25020 [Duganella sp. LX20W]|uniref:Bulb-type lectin domain-containing protein n=1 Tax=Rugamonas brunnea TaxID=2758569 RepID=A0A7W2EXB2_9BURK|nr:hypothetical protein [Rugamonas brunnea]MBA5640327.1 hypothetical protein [Rugamonas brunnea]
MKILCIKIALAFFVVKSSICCAKDVLRANEILQNDAFIISPNGIYFLAMQSDGSLVMYRNDGSIRYSMAKHGTVAIMQGDGNFVEYAGTTPLWNSNTANCCPYPAYLQIYDNGDLAINWSNSTGSFSGSVWGIGPDPAPSGTGPSGVDSLVLAGTPPSSVPNPYLPNSYAN